MRFLSAMVLSVPVVLHTGCASTEPELQLSFYPTEIISPVVNAQDDVLPTVKVGVINENSELLTVSVAALVGEINNVAVLRPSVTPDAPILVEPGAVLPLTLTAGNGTGALNKELWRTGAVSGSLRITASVAAQSTDALGTQADVGQRITRTVELPVTIPFDCDLDGDGSDDGVCGGDDCDDTTAGVGPEATEVCDGVDNDCNGEVDEGCAPD